MKMVLKVNFVLVLLLNVLMQGIQASTRDIFLDSPTACGKTFPAGDLEVFRVKPRGTVGVSNPPTSCAVYFESSQASSNYKFEIVVEAASFKDCGLQLRIFDGKSSGGSYLRMLGCGSTTSTAQFYSKDRAMSLMLTRTQNEYFFGSDFQLRIQLYSGTIECNYGSEHLSDEYGYNDRLLGATEITIIIVGCFAFVIVIVIVIVCFCFLKQYGIIGKRTEENLGHVNTAASVHILNGNVPHSNGPNSTRPWMAESSTHEFASIQSPNLPNAEIARSQRTMGGDSSVFDSNANLPVQTTPSSPNVNTNPRATSERSGSSYREEYDIYENDRCSC